MTVATVRQATTFHIIPFDADGNRCEGKASEFFVAIHGRGVRVRARVTEEEDGSFLVCYKCIQSGTYYINISLGGEVLKGSPFVCRASTPTAYAPKCIVNGNSLHQAIARVQQVFEIQFKDAHGDVAHAEELNVYVEPIELPAPSAHSEHSDAISDVSDPPQSPEPHSPPKSPKRPPTSPPKSPQLAPTSPPKSPQSARASPAKSPEKAGLSPQKSPEKASEKAVAFSGDRNLGTSASWPKTPVPKLEMKECVVTSKSPLIVRAGLDLHSERLGQLRPGRKITLLKVQQQEEQDGATSMRACIALDEGEGTHRVEVEGIFLGSWRDVYPERPLWWDELELGSPRTPRSYRRQVPLGWVTVSRGDKGKMARDVP